MKKILATLGIAGLLALNVGQVFAAPAPSIDSITPSSGPVGGGTSVTIAGMHLESASVTIGGAAATNVAVAINGQSLTATTPAGTVGSKDVVVVNTNGTSTLPGGFTYVSSSTPTFTLSYTAGANGTLTGSSTQIVASGANGTAVTAVANANYHFVNWSDNSTANPRTDLNASSSVTVTANFAADTAIASCNGSTFDTFTTGTVNGQGGWHVSGPFDQEVVSNTYGYSTLGCKSLRLSNATSSAFIFNQTFSASTSEAGEINSLNNNGATGTLRNRFEAQFDLASVMQTEQSGMHMSVSPDRGDGTRMSALGFSDTAGGIDVFFDDVTGTSSPVNFNEVQIATGLSRSVPHTIKFLMDFMEGASNDIVKIFIDGNLVHTGTSWENFYRYDADAFPAPNPNLSRTVNSLVFYVQAPATLANQSKGFLIDNVAISATTTATTTIPVSTSTPPVITLNGSSTLNVIVNTSFTDPGATASDDVDGSVIVTATGTVNTAVVGGYLITYTATDSHSNVASTTRTVNVVAAPASSSTPPVITLNGSSTMNITLNSTFTDPGATATDNEDGSISVVATGTVNTASIGSYTITYTATDSDNNVASTTRTVNVAAPSTFPVIILNGFPSMNVVVNDTFNDPGASATDDVDATVIVTATGTVNTAVLGDYVITYTATDSNNNTSTATRVVHVIPVPSTPNGGTGGGGGGGGYSIGGFRFLPLPGYESVTSTNPSTGGSPISVSLVSTPTGQVLGVAVYNFKRNMKLGSTGDDVQELQRFLISEGYLVLKNPTKYFGAMTMKALQKWQKARGLPATGYFGPMSRAEIIR